ncbi:transcriptional regulator, partial [Escherichia coli]|nr:transcriptional regulator [Escherichia coli]
QCQNINCSCTFMTMETLERFIVTPGATDPAPPHPTVSGQRPLWL